MYTPYDRQQDEAMLGPAMIGAGAIGVGGAGAVIGSTAYHTKNFKNFAQGKGRGSAENMNRLRTLGSGLKGDVGNAVQPFFQMYRKHYNDTPENAAKFKVHSNLNKIDNASYGAFGNKLKDGTRMAKMPMGYLMAGVTMKDFGNRHGAAGIGIGLATEVAGAAGFAAASAAGRVAGTAMFGAKAGGPIGMIAGAVAGMAIYGAYDSLQWMAKKGRQWTNPDFGGSFQDSEMGQTMRQRSLNMIRSSQFNLRSQLGNEALNLAMGNF